MSYPHPPGTPPPSSRAGYRAPPNSPSGLNASPVMFRRERNSGSGVAVVSYTVDLRAIAYADRVDENLMCPICHCAFIDPVTTGCDHTYCQECILMSLEMDKTCPMDRSELSAFDLVKPQKLVCNQLDNLKVICPCCDFKIPRAMITHHLEKYCPDAMIQCPGSNSRGGTCQETIKRKLKEKGCLHYFTTCADCGAITMEAGIDDHREKSCRERFIACELCSQTILRCKKVDHDNVCPDTIIACKYDAYGCEYEAKRIDQQSHVNNDCAFRLIGPVAEKLKEQISSLGDEIRTLQDKNDYQERRIKFLERGPDHPDRFMDFTHDLPNNSSSNAASALNADALPNPDLTNEYMLSLIEENANRHERLVTDLSELDTKHTRMLYNETLPIKNEINEMRSSLQMNSVHTRWLMRFRIQENQRRFGGGAGFGPGPGPGPSGVSDGSGSPGGGDPLPRRLSDARTRL